MPELAAFIGEQPTHAGNKPAPFVVKAEEQAERDHAYGAIPLLRCCQGKGVRGQSERRQQFGALLGMAKVDLRWRRLKAVPEFIFCYERLVGAQWRQLLIPCWIESAHQRRKKGPVQLPLDRRLRDDAAVPSSLEGDRPPMYYPSMVDADAIGSPLLAGL